MNRQLILQPKAQWEQPGVYRQGANSRLCRGEWEKSAGPGIRKTENPPYHFLSSNENKLILNALKRSMSVKEEKRSPYS